MIGPLVGSVLMGRIGTDGFVWMAVVCHLAIAMFLMLRMVQYREPLRAKPWSEVAFAGRVFYIPVTVIGMGRRLLRQRRTIP
jgi:uncharacterized membrane protein YfcA